MPMPLWPVLWLSATTVAPSNRRGRRNANRASVARAYVGIPEAAEYLDLSEKTVRRMVDTGQVTAYRFGRNVLKLKLADLDAIYTVTER